MKKLLAFILALACALSLMACGKKNNDTPDPDPVPDPKPAVTTAEFTHGYVDMALQLPEGWSWETVTDDGDSKTEGIRFYKTDDTTVSYTLLCWTGGYGICGTGITSEELTLAKMNVYELKDDRKMALKQLRSLVDSHPNEPNYKVMLGNWLLQNDRKNDAYKLFTAAVEADPESEYALTSLYDYYRQAGRDSLATQLRDRILLSAKTNIKTKTSMVKQVIDENEAQGGDSTQVLALLDRMEQASPKDANVAMLRAVYMELKKMPDSTVCHALQKVIDISPDNATARLQLLQKLWPMERWDDIIVASSQAIQYIPDEMAFYYFLGLAHYQKDESDAALDAFRRGVGEITQESNPEFVSDFYALMGDILYTKGQEEEAFAAYDSCLQWKSDNISCLNNYAYYLSEKNLNLTKAEEMSYRTVKAEPDNATYLDTYAWILYQQKRYAEAKIYIDQAVKNDTDTVHVTPVVIDHAGEIYMKLGDPDRAVSFWQLAISRGGDKALFERKIKKAKK